jgi:hypothetical protein
VLYILQRCELSKVCFNFIFLVFLSCAIQIQEEILKLLLNRFHCKYGNEITLSVSYIVFSIVSKFCIFTCKSTIYTTLWGTSKQDSISHFDNYKIISFFYCTFLLLNLRSLSYILIDISCRLDIFNLRHFPTFTKFEKSALFNV